MFDLIIFCASVSGILWIAFFLWPDAMKTSFLIDMRIIKNELAKFANSGGISFEHPAFKELDGTIQRYMDHEYTVRLPYYIIMHYILKNNKAVDELMKSIPPTPKPDENADKVLSGLRSRMLRVVSDHAVWTCPLFSFAYYLFGFLTNQIKNYNTWRMTAHQKIEEKIWDLQMAVKPNAH